MNQEVKNAMAILARQLRSRVKWANDGWYDDAAARARNAAIRDTLEEVASAIDNAFDVDSTRPPGPDEF